jgi:hypothetical protein
MKIKMGTDGNYKDGNDGAHKLATPAILNREVHINLGTKCVAPTHNMVLWAKTKTSLGKVEKLEDSPAEISGGSRPDAYENLIK